MIVDTSALAAILFGESDRSRYVEALAEFQPAAIGAPTRLELMIVCGHRGGISLQSRAAIVLNDFLIQTIDFTGQMAEIAMEAVARFGRGSGHPARLNFGDCMSYAVARTLDRPLLFKGDDFSRTDVGAAL